MARNLFRAARRSIADVRRAQRADLAGDVGATQSQLDAIYSNLTTAGRGVGANLTATQARELAAIQRLVQRGVSRSRQVVGRAQAGAVRRYGTAQGPVAATALAPARAVVGATRVGARGIAAGAGILAQGGQQALAIQRVAGTEARASADYAAAVAEATRGRVDAETIAQMQFQLQQTRLEFNLAEQAAESAAARDFDYWRQKIDYETEKTTGANLAQIYASAPMIASGLSTLGITYQPLDERGNPEGAEVRYTPAQLANEYAEQAGVIGPDGTIIDGGRYQLILQMATNYLAGMGPVEAAQTAVAALYGESAGFDVTIANETLMTGIRAQNTRSLIDLLSRLANGQTFSSEEENYLIRLLASRGDVERASLWRQTFAIETSITRTNLIKDAAISTLSAIGG